MPYQPQPAFSTMMLVSVAFWSIAIRLHRRGSTSCAGFASSAGNTCRGVLFQRQRQPEARPFSRAAFLHDLSSVRFHDEPRHIKPDAARTLPGGVVNLVDLVEQSGRHARPA